ncbi:MAG: hypothetical protein NTV84_10800 [Methanoregula sp.]|nr:hypothetical protein [Methanoregula sp.]
METGRTPNYLQHPGLTPVKFVGFTVALPIVLAMLFTIPGISTLALITTSLIIEYCAAPVGIGLGLQPVFVIVVLTSAALAVTPLSYDIFDTLGTSTLRVVRFLLRSKQRAERSKILSKYGINGLVPCVMILGFYACPPIAWVVGWLRNYAILLTMAGFILISRVTILATPGVIRIFMTGA